MYENAPLLICKKGDPVFLRLGFTTLDIKTIYDHQVQRKENLITYYLLH